MKNLNYKGYYAVVDFEANSDVFVGRLIGITDIITSEPVFISSLRSYAKFWIA